MGAQVFLDGVFTDFTQIAPYPRENWVPSYDEAAYMSR